MSNESEDNGFQIFIDEPELEDTVLDFPNYINTLSNIILKSKPPKYTVGIFGEWGTGKSTLMGNILKVLESHECKCLEFNAWRYEGEDRLATFPMMLNILGQFIDDTKVRNILEKEDNEENRGILKSLKRVLRGLSVSGSVGLQMAAELGFSYDPSQAGKKEDTEEDILEFYKKNIPALQEGYELIKKLIPLADGANGNDELKLVVFVDDLDRCTPEKASEVLESIKVFFDIKGIVFVLGLSKTVVEAAINVKYKDFEETFNGSDYLKKIIQVPFHLPEWSKDDLKKYIKNIVEKTKNQKYKEFFQEENTQKIIADVINSNPREAKRLLNNFILARNIFNNDTRVDNLKLLLSQALVLRWKEFYDYVFLHPKRLQDVKKIITPSKRQLTKESMIRLSRDIGSGTLGIAPPPKQEEKSIIDEDPITKMLKDEELVAFLKGVGSQLLEMDFDEWKLYRRTNQIDADIIYLKEPIKKRKEKQVEVDTKKEERNPKGILRVKINEVARQIDLYNRLSNKNPIAKMTLSYKRRMRMTSHNLELALSQVFPILKSLLKKDPVLVENECYRIIDQLRKIGFTTWASRFESLVKSL